MINLYKSSEDTICELAFDEIDKGCWVELINPSSDELALITEKTGVYLDFLTAALDDEERSRIEVEQDQLLILIDIPLLRSNKDYDTLPLGIIITTDYIITVCLEVNAVLADFSTHNARSFCTFKKTRFLFQILYKSALLYLKYIRNINRRTDELEQHLRKSMDNDELFKLLDLEKSLTYFSASLRSNFNVTEKLLRLRSTNQVQHLIKMYEEDEDLLEDVIIEYRQAIEMVEMYSHILNGMLEIFASIISNNLNLVMRLLASITIILAVPTMLSSFWGMNVPVPLSENPLGFLWVVGLAITLTSACAFWLWKKRMF
ncbi:magnesium transporter CorA family protein [Succinispira mobilis]|uniref:magnesium transporter CorA family protein n=1 Tax=Succinispira mobilis TaxID=78120 RepID=UPI00037F5A38|nr:magnesium transporter CorA family protein [Succinispira mobilis]